MTADRLATRHPFYNIEIPVEEEWRDIKGYEGYFQVSSWGRIRSVTRTVRHWRGGTQVVNGRIRKTPKINEYGYLMVQLNREGKGRMFLVHRLVLEAFIGPCPDGMECCHEDGNASNNRLENIRWGTALENGADRVRHGRVYKQTGEKHWNCKLTEEDVLEILARLRAGIGVPELVREFGVTEGTIRGIKTGRTWSHLERG